MGIRREIKDEPTKKDKTISFEEALKKLNTSIQEEEKLKEKQDDPLKKAPPEPPKEN